MNLTILAYDLILSGRLSGRLHSVASGRMHTLLCPAVVILRECIAFGDRTFCKPKRWRSTPDANFIKMSRRLRISLLVLSYHDVKMPCCLLLVPPAQDIEMSMVH